MPAAARDHEAYGLEDPSRAADLADFHASFGKITNRYRGKLHVCGAIGDFRSLSAIQPLYDNP